jgi:anti-sigma regulatory factor (Ser/Thr protein kinase)
MTTLRTSAPPPRAVELGEWGLSSGDELRLLRSGLRRALDAHTPAEADLSERVTLVATELASNALRHGRPPVAVRLLRAGEEVIVDVTDQDPGGFPQPADRDDRRYGGRGLIIAGTLSTEICWYAAEGTKHVWASFPAA